MTADYAYRPGAASHDGAGAGMPSTGSKVHRNVRRLQARIVKAIQAGRWGKVKALQHLLTHSFSGKALAVRRVTENHGKRTPGVDGTIWDTPGEEGNGSTHAPATRLSAQPLRRVYIPKKNGKTRPLGIPDDEGPSHAGTLPAGPRPIAETTADPNSYGFRKERPRRTRSSNASSS